MFHYEQGLNILKTRDDFAPVEIRTEDEKNFKVKNSCSWANPEETLTYEKLRPRIEPWLTALAQSEHLSVLIGSGLSQAIHVAAKEASINYMKSFSPQYFSEELTRAANESAKIVGRQDPNIEDQIRVASELLIGLKHYCGAEGEGVGGIDLKQRVDHFEKEIEDLLEDFSSSILVGERNIVSAPKEKRERAFNLLVNFIMSFASRYGSKERLHIFTTNYDRVIEAGAELAGLHLIDRFIGNLAPIFRSSRLNIDMHYNPPGIRGEPRFLEGVVRFTKLHGSIDWVYTNRDIRRVGLPFGAKEISPYLQAPGLLNVSSGDLMVFPNSAKDRETASYPYVELFRDFATSICRPNHTLVVYGYSFGDEHINRVIEDMLTIPSTHLVVVAYDDIGNRILNTYKRIGRHSQFSLLIGNHLGCLESLVNYFLPKPSIDRATYRMSELLKTRYELAQDDHSEVNQPEGERENEKSC